MTATDPFNRAYAAIETALTSWTPLVPTLVKLGNVRNLQDPHYKPKKSVGDADRVELYLGESSVSINLYERSSLLSDFHAIYPLLISSGSLGIVKANQIVWEATRAIARTGRLLGLDDVVQKYRIEPNVSVVFGNAQADRGTDQWSALLRVHVFFAMRTAAFLAP